MPMQAPLPDEQEVDELDSLLDQYDAEAKAQVQQAANKAARKRGRGALPGMERGRDAGLERPIDPGNRGFQLMQKMGETGGP